MIHQTKNFLMIAAFFFLLTASLLLPGLASAHPSEPGETPHVWSGKALPEFCTSLFMPVHDARGTIYTNACTAARDGIRVTWDGTHR